jgi:hypothetical protein
VSENQPVHTADLVATTAPTAGTTPATASPAPGGTVPVVGMGPAKTVGPVVIRDILLPYAVYYIAHREGVSNVSALAVGGAVNVVFVAAGLVRKRSLNVLGLIVLITFALGIAASYLTGDARFALAKDSVITGGVGIAFLVSLLTARPAMFAMIRQMVSDGDPVKAAAIDARWDTSAHFRRTQRLMTGVWGAGLLAEAIIRLIVISIVAVSTGAAASTAILLTTFALLIAWTRFYLPRRAARQS